MVPSYWIVTRSEPVLPASWMQQQASGKPWMVRLLVFGLMSDGLSGLGPKGTLDAGYINLMFTERKGRGAGSLKSVTNLQQSH